MQKILNTGRVVHYTLVGLILSNRKASLLVGLILLLAGLTNPARAASGFYKDYVVLNGQYYYTNFNDTYNPSFQGSGRILGPAMNQSFDRGNGQLILGGEANTFNDNGDDVQSVQLYYRVYLQGSVPPNSFVSLGLPFQFAGGDNSGNNKRWSNRSTNPNLLAATNGPGRYVLEVYFQGNAVYNNPGGSGSFSIFDSRSGANYTTTFDVTGSVPVQWNGGARDGNWFNAANWTPNNVPSPSTDATIPFISGGGVSAYPTISSGTAQVRTLRIEGSNGTIGARNFLSGGELQVFGDFQDPNGGFGQTGGFFTLAGGTQTFDGAQFSDFRVQGGGTKILTNRMDISSSLAFVGSGGIISTHLDNSVLYNVDLGAAATISGESETSYVLGVLRATNRVVTQNNTNSFGNIGVDLTARNGSPGLTLATRVTGYVYSGENSSKSIKRSFTFTPDNPNNQNFSLVFHYLDVELNSIQESKLQLFRSLTGGVPFQNLRAASTDPVANTLTQDFIPGTLAATFTLGDATAPLPVTVASFNAVAQGTDAVLTWTTAQESNSKGFEVQVSLDGKTFRELGFVASATPNSSALRAYQYRDAAAGKQGLRYYRLRQLDLDGKESFFGPQAVAFGALAAASAQGYPNPFTSEINLILQPAAAGLATVNVIDGLGRQVRTWQPTLELGAASLRLDELQALPHGLYVVQVRYSNGHTERLKLMK